MNNGWISLPRNIKDDPLWDCEPLSKMQAYIDLIMTVNHTDGRTIFNNEYVTIKRGQRIVSIRKLSVSWKWSASKVKRFLELLESDGKIKTERYGNGTLLTLVNYDEIQNQRNTYDTPIEQERNTYETLAKQERNTCETEANTNNNNINNYNNGNNDINNENNIPPISPQGESEGEKTKRFVKPTVEQVQEYCDSRNNGISSQEFIDYYDSIGWNVGKKPMKDWQAAIRTWENKRKTTNSTGYVKRWNV